MTSTFFKILLIASTLAICPSGSGETISGTWLIRRPGQTYASGFFTFLPNGTYFMADDGDSVADPSGQDGMERGTYTWNALSGQFFAQPTVDTTGEWGLSNLTYPITVLATNGTLTGKTAEGTFVLGKLAASTNPIVGSWTGINLGTSHSIGVITFLADNEYLLALDGDSIADPSGMDGMERGHFDWNPLSGAFSATAFVDTTGEWGLSHLPVGTTVRINGDVLSFTTSEGSISLSRIEKEPGMLPLKMQFIPSDRAATLSWGSKTNAVYDLDSSSDCQNWSSFKRVSGNGGELQETLSVDGGLKLRFLRVRETLSIP